MKVIFLDFDGVVCCLPVEWDHTSEGHLVHSLNHPAVARLNEIVARTGAYIVVSSTWRLRQPIEHLRGYLRRAGFVGTVIGVTPHLGTERGYEISRWLEDHHEVESYVVLDDDGDRGPIPSCRWVLVKDGWRQGGLKAEHVERASLKLAIYVDHPGAQA